MEATLDSRCFHKIIPRPEFWPYSEFTSCPNSIIWWSVRFLRPWSNGDFIMEMVNAVSKWLGNSEGQRRTGRATLCNGLEFSEVRGSHCGKLMSLFLPSMFAMTHDCGVHMMMKMRCWLNFFPTCWLDNSKVCGSLLERFASSRWIKGVRIQAFVSLSCLPNGTCCTKFDTTVAVNNKNSYFRLLCPVAESYPRLTAKTLWTNHCVILKSTSNPFTLLSFERDSNKLIISLWNLLMYCP